MINVYEVPGTNVQATLTGQMQYITPDQIAQGVFYKGLDPSAFKYNFIQGYANSLKPLQASVDKGVQILGDYITKDTGKFVLIGTSQGALICSQVYKKMVAGQIPNLSNCVGIFMLGNPARQAGRAFPGCPVVPGGHGIAPPSWRLTNTPDMIWEFANPGDPVCTNGDDPISQLREQAFNSFLYAWDGNLLNLGQAVIDVLGWAAFAVTAAPGMAFFHCGYDSYKPIPGDNRSATQIVVDYLNTIQAPQYRADGWSTTLTIPA